MTKQEKTLKQVKTEIQQQLCFISIKKKKKKHVYELHYENLFEVNVAKTFCRSVPKRICVVFLDLK